MKSRSNENKIQHRATEPQSKERQVSIPVIYKGLHVPAAHYRLDILVEGQIIL